MPIDLAALATTVVTSFLIPYVKAGLEKIATAVTEKVSEPVAEYAKELTGNVWNLVTSAFRSPKEQTTMELFQENPDEMQEMLIKKLQEKLDQDPNLAQTLANLIDQPGPDGTTTGAQIMHAGIAGIADLRGANLSHAQNMDISGVKIGDKPTPTSDKPSSNT
jgi:hypothetical protein